MRLREITSEAIIAATMVVAKSPMKRPNVLVELNSTGTNTMIEVMVAASTGVVTSLAPRIAAARGARPRSR